MEILLVYSLVFLCLLGFALLSVLILPADPAGEEIAPAHPAYPSSMRENLTAYGVLTALFLFFIITTMQSRRQYFHFRLHLGK